MLDPTEPHGCAACEAAARPGGRIMLFGGLTLAAVIVCHFWIDKPVARWAARLPERAENIADHLGLLGSSPPYLIPAAAGFVLFRYRSHRRRAAWRCALVFAAVAVSGIVNNVLKICFGRARPKLLIEQGRYGYQPFSFSRAHYDFTAMPSGHTMVVFAVAAALCMFYPRYRWLWLTLATLIAVTRIISGSHYPGDVIAGVWFAAVLTYLTALLFRRRRLI